MTGTCNHTRTAHFGRGLAAGLAAGAAGTICMDLLSWVWTGARHNYRGGEPAHEREKSFHSQGGRPDVEDAKKAGRHSGERSSAATTRVAEAVAEPILQRPLTPQERKTGGMIVHYGFGAAAGAIYGAAAEVLPAVTSGVGVPFGMALWSGTIGSTLPALGLTRRVKDYDRQEHAFGVAAHVVYGLVTELSRRGLRALIRD